MKLICQLLSLSLLAVMGCFPKDEATSPETSGQPPEATQTTSTSEDGDLSCCSPASLRQLPSAEAVAQADQVASAVPPSEEEEQPGPLPAPGLPTEGRFTPLNKANTLYIQSLPNRLRRIWIRAEVCLREGPLEVFLCRAGTKEHESIVAADLDARMVHSALLAIGAKAGEPVTFYPEYKAASGEKIKVSVYALKERGKPPVLEPAQQWITNIQTKKPMTENWVFAGSRFFKDEFDPDAKPYYAANNGEMISVSNFVDSMLDVPTKSTDEADRLLYRANTEKIPPLGSKVWVILELASKGT